MAQTIDIYPHEIGQDLIPELATRVYSSQLDSFREAISNAFDEDSKQVTLTITKDKIVIEDWGNGIKDYDEFRKFGQASKKYRDGEVIGEKGLGKLSLLNLGSNVCFETNNQKVGIKFYMNLAGFSKPVYGKSRSFVDHKGTRITITRLTSKVELTEVISYLKKAFGLRLAQGATIIINSEPVKPKSTLDPNETLLFRLKKHRTEVTGNLRTDKEGKGMADVYIDHVFVANLEVDTRRSFTGWVNCNILTPETSRNNIVQNDAYAEFMNSLRKYVSRFPLREIAIDEHKLMLSRELNTLLKRYIKDMKISISDNKITKFEGRTRKSLGIDRKDAPSKVLQETDSIQPLHMSNKLKASGAATGSSVRWEYADFGNEKGPMHFVPPNTVYCNTTNDLFRFAMMKSRNYGPTWIRILPYLARIAVEINMGTLRVSPDQFNLRVDEATRYFLRQKKVID